MISTLPKLLSRTVFTVMTSFLFSFHVNATINSDTVIVSQMGVNDSLSFISSSVSDSLSNEKYLPSYVVKRTVNNSPKRKSTDLGTYNMIVLISIAVITLVMLLGKK